MLYHERDIQCLFNIGTRCSPSVQMYLAGSDAAGQGPRESDQRRESQRREHRIARRGTDSEKHHESGQKASDERDRSVTGALDDR